MASEGPQQQRQQITHLARSPLLHQDHGFQFAGTEVNSVCVRGISLLPSFLPGLCPALTRLQTEVTWCWSQTKERAASPPGRGRGPGGSEAQEEQLLMSA